MIRIPSAPPTRYASPGTTRHASPSMADGEACGPRGSLLSPSGLCSSSWRSPPAGYTTLVNPPGIYSSPSERSPRADALATAADALATAAGALASFEGEAFGVGAGGGNAGGGARVRPSSALAERAAAATTARPRSAGPWQRGSPLPVALPASPPPWQPSSPAAACGGGGHAGATPPFREVCSSWEGGKSDSQGRGPGNRSPRGAQVRPSSARPARPSPAHPRSPRESPTHHFPASARPSSARRPVGAAPPAGVEFNKLSRADRRAHVLGLIYKHQEQQRGRQTFF